MSNDDKIPVDGVITGINRGGIFNIEVILGNETREIIGRCSGKMRKFKIKLVCGDRVRIELSPYDLEQGTIVRRI